MARDDRTLEIRIESGEFPCDGIQVRTVAGQERISQLFSFDITFAAPGEGALDPQVVAGARASLVFLVNGHERRRIHGVVAELVDLLDTGAELWTYRMRLVPRAWRLGLVRVQEIFMPVGVGTNNSPHTSSGGNDGGSSSTKSDRKEQQKIGIQQVIEQKLETARVPGAFLLSGGDDLSREFIVQFDETDLAFVSRLAEQVGWSYWFDHEEEGDRIVFTDGAPGFRHVHGAEAVPFERNNLQVGVSRIEETTRPLPAMYMVSDYNYMTPQVDLSATREIANGYFGGAIEFGTHYDTPAQGALFARVRAEEGQLHGRVLRGEASACTLTAGARVRLTGHERLGDVELLVVAVEHRYEHTAQGAEKEAGGYRAVFEAIPGDVPFRPPRATPRPLIHGVMSGIVEADPGIDTEQAWIDDHGRYLVRMMFDTGGDGNDKRKASLPIRMAQPHAGPSYGVHYPLRPGTEVLVAFTGGNPDRPVILAAVPNAVTPTPVAAQDRTLHRQRTWSGVLVEIDDGG